MQVCVVIPAYEPDEAFVPYAQALMDAGLNRILVVDDGSGPDYAPIFAALRKMGCTVLTHEYNKGKGAALKTALRWYGDHTDGYGGIVTADCDGQHTVQDVSRVCRAMEQYPGTLVLGCRDFGPGTPARSATGNRVTSAAMHALYNIDLKDTQTGLRGIPNEMHRDLLQLRGDRYEFELNMLIYARQRGIPYTIVPIQTVYFNNNEASHYRTVADSVRILHQMGSGLVQYALSAGLSVVVDVFIYCVLVKWLLLGLPVPTRLFLSVVIARTLSSIVNYSCNRRLPYVQNKKIGPTAAKYYCLWLVQMMLSFAGVWVFNTWLEMDDMLSKLLVDAVLAVASYQVQLRWVFSKKGQVTQILAGETADRTPVCPPQTAEDAPKPKHFYGPLARLMRVVVRACLYRWDTSGAHPAQPPAVYVVHHRNMSGPVHTLALLNDTPRLWVLHVFADREACFHQYYDYTFSRRFGWPAWAAWLAASALSLVVPAVMRSFRAIPVYRSLKQARGMMEESVQSLMRGENILLCPDIEYDSAQAGTGEIYTGFLKLEQMYHAKTGGHLKFVPVFCSAQKRIVTGKAIEFADGVPFRAQRADVAQAIVAELNALAVACGETGTGEDVRCTQYAHQAE